MGKLAAVRFARSTPDTVVNALQPLLETHGFRYAQQLLIANVKN